MRKRRMRIGVMCPASRIGPELEPRVAALAREVNGPAEPDIVFHPQCFLSDGHFAGPDAARADALLDFANDDSIDAVWFGRGGYGSCRLLDLVLPRLTPVARRKTYLGYSDAGTLLAALHRNGCTGVAHGPMPQDAMRQNGAAAVRRALGWLVAGDREALEPNVAAGEPAMAFNITILSHVLGTPYQPDLDGQVLMLEEVSEHIYRIDRALFHITSNPGVRRAAGIRLGRCSQIPPNEPDFGIDEQEVARHWCAHAGIPWLGTADIGHDADNKVVPFGRAAASI